MVKLSIIETNKLDVTVYGSDATVTNCVYMNKKLHVSSCNNTKNIFSYKYNPTTNEISTTPIYYSTSLNNDFSAISVNKTNFFGVPNNTFDLLSFNLTNNTSQYMLQGGLSSLKNKIIGEIKNKITLTDIDDEFFKIRSLMTYRNDIYFFVQYLDMCGINYLFIVKATQVPESFTIKDSFKLESVYDLIRECKIRQISAVIARSLVVSDFAINGGNIFILTYCGDGIDTTCSSSSKSSSSSSECFKYNIEMDDVKSITPKKKHFNISKDDFTSSSKSTSIVPCNRSYLWYMKFYNTMSSYFGSSFYSVEIDIDMDTIYKGIACIDNDTIIMLGDIDTETAKIEYNILKIENLIT